jgi:NitT/TauT family transport system ATP-binding protein
MLLEVTGLNKTYGTGPGATEAVHDLTFGVQESEFACIVGPSGCGKTTLLRCLAGLLPATRGEVTLRGKQVDRTPDDMALVFQEYSRSLFPWMTVRQNVAFPLKRKKHSKAKVNELVERSLTAVRLDQFADHYPWQLSGGMQQRVAIARALAYEPAILLMDEPFASLDAQTRADLEDLTLQLRHEFGVTIVFVTHDIDEAVYLSDRVIALTQRPTQVQEILDIPLPRPRDQLTTKELPEFTHLRAHVYRLIKRPDDEPSGSALLSAAQGA